MRHVNNYKLNIISPSDMSDRAFSKFSTCCGYALKIIKHRHDEARVADMIKKGVDHKHIDLEVNHQISEP